MPLKDKQLRKEYHRQYYKKFGLTRWKKPILTDEKKLAIQKYNKEHYKKNGFKARDAHRLLLKDLKKQVHDKLGNRCSNIQCRWTNEDGTLGCKNTDCLQIDHVNNDGYKERENCRNYVRLLKKVLVDLESRYQLLCANCNWIKKSKLKIADGTATLPVDSTESKPSATSSWKDYTPTDCK